MEREKLFSDREDIKKQKTEGYIPSAAFLKRILRHYDPLHGDASDTIRKAAVLVPVVLHENGPSILFTKRTDHLKSHAGQVSFPGGKAEPQDKNAVDTALRETEEEVGVSRERIEVIGRLDTCTTATGFKIVPIVGLIRPPFDIDPDPSEVAKVFEVPLMPVLEKDLLQQVRKEYAGKSWNTYSMVWKDWYIWGATAVILKNLVDIINTHHQEDIQAL